MIFPAPGKQKDIDSSHTLFQYLFGSGGSSIEGYQGSALSNATVFSCVRIIAFSLAMLPLKLRRDVESGGRRHSEIILPSANPVARALCERPNDWQTPFEFWQMMIGHVLLRGNAVAYKQKDTRGQVRFFGPASSGLG